MLSFHTCMLVFNFNYCFMWEFFLKVNCISCLHISSLHSAQWEYRSEALYCIFDCLKWLFIVLFSNALYFRYNQILLDFFGILLLFSSPHFSSSFALSLAFMPLLLHWLNGEIINVMSMSTRKDEIISLCVDIKSYSWNELRDIVLYWFLRTYSKTNVNQSLPRNLINRTAAPFSNHQPQITIEFVGLQVSSFASILHKINVIKKITKIRQWS